MIKIFKFEFLGSILQFSESLNYFRDLLIISESFKLFQGPDCEKKLDLGFCYTACVDPESLTCGS